MAEKLIPVVVCKTRPDAETYLKLLTDAEIPATIVESDSYSDSISYEVSVDDPLYDKAFAVIEEYEES